MSELNLKCPADFHGGIQDDWDNEYASMWAQVQSLSHNKMQYRKAWMAAKDENARLQSEVERLSQYIIMNGDRIFSGDWACAQCHPNSDILVDGFECGFHLAQRLRQQAAESEDV